MKIEILDNIPFKVDNEKLKERLHITDEYDISRIDRLVEEAIEIGRPKVLIGEAFIDRKDADSVTIEGITFRSRVLRANLDKVYKVFPYLMTCGRELDLWAGSIDDILENYWAEAIKETALRCAVKHAEEYLREKYHVNKASSMNPGSLEDWPLSEQKPFFSLLGNTEDTVGVRLTDSCLMIPNKSISGIYFVSDTDYENCRLCPREGCPGRRAPYDEKLYAEMFGTS